MEIKEPRAAGVRHEDRLAAGASTAEIARRARVETDATVRVYAKEWVMLSRRISQESAEQYLTINYAGRLHPGDSKIVVDDEGGIVTYEVWAQLWNVTAEWKYGWQAEEWAGLIRMERSLPEDTDLVRVVGRNSRQEHALRAYGKLLLPSVSS